MARKKRLTDFDMECIERRAQGAAAWGAYGAHVRQQNYDRESQRHNEAIRKASSSETKAKAEAEKKKFEETAQRQNGILHVGPF